MKKIRLDLDALEVESFNVDSPSAGTGTVLGRELPNSDNIFCLTVVPCVPSDRGSCGASCGQTCVEYRTCGDFSCYVTECGPNCPVWV
jgi:hypothetical protein